MKKSLPGLLAVCALALLSACTTPDSRIKKNPDAFAKFPPETQEMIKKGQIALGFDQEMVRFAIGNPDRIRTRVDADGSKEVWSYTSYHVDTTVGFYGGYYPGYYGAYAYRPWGYYPYWGAGFGGWGYPYSGSIPYEQFRVEFRGGKVTSIEQEES